MTYNAALEAFIEVINQKQGQIDSEASEITIEDDGIYCDDWIGDYVKDSNDDSDYGQIGIPADMDRESYKRICKEILDRVLNVTIWEAKQKCYEENLRKYCMDFAEELKRDWKLFKGVPLDPMPVIISWNHAENKNCAGDFLIPSGVIQLFGVIGDHGIDEVCKKSARHEIIHRMLYFAKLSCLDDSCLFWVLATIYDANPYKQMNEANQQAFDFFMDIYRTEGKEAMEAMIEEQIKTKKGEKHDDKGNVSACA